MSLNKIKLFQIFCLIGLIVVVSCVDEKPKGPKVTDIVCIRLLVHSLSQMF